jgi:hypothetical protein
MGDIYQSDLPELFRKEVKQNVLREVSINIFDKLRNLTPETEEQRKGLESALEIIERAITFAI